MNTRLQVEHPVTEEVTRVRGERVDLVELQLLVATGEPLGITQEDITLDGHAIEARVYAEDSFGGFLPQAGVVTHLRWTPAMVDEDAPRQSGPFIRVDHGLESGQEVSTAYDPMLGKVIAWGEDRDAAREALVEALDGTAILGLTTNTGFLRTLAASDEFRDATIDTAWLDRHHLPAPDDADARALAGIVLGVVLDAEPRGPWQPDGFRLGGPPGPLVEFGRDLSAHGWSAAPRSANGLQRVGSLSHGDGFVLRGRHGTEVVVRGQRFVLDDRDPFADGAATAGDGTLLAPMPGTVLAVNVAEGQAVAEGETLGVMEAMKMELALKAPFVGTVTAVGASVGDLVPLGAALFTVEPGDG